jgi:creatinine amidohydrolase
MRITDMNWMQVEDYLKRDNRCVLPVGCTEQHAYLSLSVDSILAERVALESAEPLNIPVFPVLHYGITPYFRAYPGTISLKTETYLRIIRDILDGMVEQGFKRILVVNGHGGNSPGATLAMEFMVEHPDVTVQWHNWWNAPRTWAKVQQIDPVASHASWMENFPWTRLPGVPMPDVQKPAADLAKLRNLPPKALRETLGDGNYAGYYQRPDEDSQALWDVAIAETRDLLENGW